MNKREASQIIKIELMFLKEHIELLEAAKTDKKIVHSYKLHWNKLQDIYTEVKEMELRITRNKHFGKFLKK